MPAELGTLGDGAQRIVDSNPYRSWAATSAALKEMRKAWADLSKADVPVLVAPRLADALRSLERAVASRDGPATRQAALDVRQWSLDTELRYRPAAEINLQRFDLWAAQVELDAQAGDRAAVGGDVFTLDARSVQRLNVALEALETAAIDRDFAGSIGAAKQLRAIVADVVSGSR
jgi:hypothetical protein